MTANKNEEQRPLASLLQRIKSGPRRDPQYLHLVQWASEYYEKNYPGQAFDVVWASPNPSNAYILNRIKPGRRVGRGMAFESLSYVDTIHIPRVHDYTFRQGHVRLVAGSGAIVFRMKREDGQAQDILYASIYHDDDVKSLTAIAVIPEGALDLWARFEALCAQLNRPRFQRRHEVHIIGGAEVVFSPDVEWGDVILPAALKEDLLQDVEAFFDRGVHLYRALKLVPFRKVLLAGVPGTGKTMLCAALARLSLQHQRVVAYVSGSDREGASFEKIHRAFSVLASARKPALLIVEELDAYLAQDDKARILNVLDGLETPNNPRGTLLIATTNYPEAIDERIAKRPGRVDRVFVIPTIQEEAQAEAMLRHYMAEQWDESHRRLAPLLVRQSGAFVREVALQARMRAAHAQQTIITLEMLEASIANLTQQKRLDSDLLTLRRPLGLDGGHD